jgi:hypothetical protein
MLSGLMEKRMKPKISVFLVLMLLLDAKAREPQTLPPLKSTVANKIVRARDLGIPFDGTPGQFNSITDVTGV